MFCSIPLLLHPLSAACPQTNALVCMHENTRKYDSQIHKRKLTKMAQSSKGNSAREITHKIYRAMLQQQTPAIYYTYIYLCIRVHASHLHVRHRSLYINVDAVVNSGGDGVVYHRFVYSVCAPCYCNVVKCNECQEVRESEIFIL